MLATTDANGVAQLAVSSLAAGDNLIDVSFSGNAALGGDVHFDFDTSL